MEGRNNYSTKSTASYQNEQEMDWDNVQTMENKSALSYSSNSKVTNGNSINLRQREVYKALHLPVKLMAVNHPSRLISLSALTGRSTGAERLHGKEKD